MVLDFKVNRRLVVGMTINFFTPFVSVFLSNASFLGIADPDKSDSDTMR